MFYEKVEALAKDAYTNLCNATSDTQRSHHGGEVAAYVNIISMATGQNRLDLFVAIIASCDATVSN